jgi:hypothetical protein
MATTYVWEHFMKACISTEVHDMMKQVAEIMTARNHRTRFPDTNAHKKFMESYAAKSKALMERYPVLDMSAEIAYFSAH